MGLRGPQSLISDTTDCYFYRSNVRMMMINPNHIELQDSHGDTIHLNLKCFVCGRECLWPIDRKTAISDYEIDSKTYRMLLISGGWAVTRILLSLDMMYCFI